MEPEDDIQDSWKDVRPEVERSPMTDPPCIICGEPVYHSDEYCLKHTLLGPRQRVLDTLTEVGPLGSVELAKILGSSTTVVLMDLHWLQHNGYVDFTHHSRTWFIV